MSLAETKYASVEIGPCADLTDYNIMQGFTGKSVTIGEGTSAIGDYFLVDGDAVDTELTELKTPSSLRTIGENAFHGRMGLSSFDLSGVESMGESAFCQTGLMSITVPGTMKEIPESAFSSCPNVKSITIEEGVEVIREYAFSTVGRGGKTTDTYNFLSDADVAQYKDVVHANDPEYQIFFEITLPSTIREVEESAFLATRLEGLYLPWLTGVDQLPAEFHPDFENYECIYVSEETFAKQGDALNAYFKQDEGFQYWAGSVRVYDGRHHYWTDRELGLDA